nr:PucR C-terminal helix-turn-helix domain protein [uncultured bacterium]
MILVRITPTQLKELSLLRDYVTPDQWSWVSANVMAVELTDDQKAEILSLFRAIIQEGINALTVLTTYRADDFSLYLLNILHQTSPRKVYNLADGFLVGLTLRDEELLVKAQRFYASLPGHLMDVVVCYCRHHGSLKACGSQLYLHRNTVNQKINEFIHLTGMDLRHSSYQLFLRILVTVLYGVP